MMRQLWNVGDLDGAPDNASVLVRTKTGEHVFVRLQDGNWIGHPAGFHGWSSQSLWEFAMEVFLLHPLPSLEAVTFDATSVDLVHIQVENYGEEDAPPTLDTNLPVPADSDWEEQLRDEILQVWGARAVGLVDFSAVRERLLNTGHARMSYQCEHGGDSDFAISLWFERGLEDAAPTSETGSDSL